MRHYAFAVRGRIVALILTISIPVLSYAQDPPAPDGVVPVVVPVIVKPGIFVPPTGLTKPVDVILRELGFIDCCSPPPCIPYSYNFCMEVAIKCHVQGRYVDSLAFATHAAAIRTTPAALYLRALNELAVNQCDDAATTVVQFNALPSMGSDITWLREKLSSPLTVRLKALFEAILERA